MGACRDASWICGLDLEFVGGAVECVATAMAELPSLLLASLRPDSRKQAEHNLHSLSLQPGFLTHLLSLVLQSAQDRAVRLAGSVYLKNIVKSRWEDVCTSRSVADLP